MLKNLFLILLLVAINSCSTYNSIDTFYNAHKNDDQVTALRVPRFMLSLIGNLSPDNNGQNRAFLYFNGNFDPAKVREMAGNEEFQNLGDGLINQYNPESPKPTQVE